MIKNSYFPIVLVFGAVCSGKNNYAKHFPDEMAKVDVGDIVRDITKTQERVHIPDLDATIGATLLKRIILAYEDNNTIGIVITGIRQKSIIRSIEKYVAINFRKGSIHRVLLDVPDNILKARYLHAARTKDLKLSFEETISRDNALGYSEVLEYLKTVNTHTIQHYSVNETNKEL